MMSKSVAFKSNEDHDTRKTVGKRGEGDEEKENEEEIMAVPATSTDDFLNSVDFRRMLLKHIPPRSTKLFVLRCLCTEWRELVEVKVGRGFESGNYGLRWESQSKSESG